MKKLMQISAFWKNDRPDGVGVTLTYEIGNLDKVFAVLQETYDLLWRQSTYESEQAQLTKDLIGQLEFVAKNKNPLGFELALMAIGNIYLLEKTGSLKADEFNGLFLAYFE